MMGPQRYLVAIENVSAPDVPCGPGLIGIFDQSTGRWTCLDKSTPCPDGTHLFVAGPGQPYEWRFCTPDIAYAEQAHGPNFAAFIPQSGATVPTLSGWALGALLVVLAFVGAQRLG
jgi:hypothetical protein